ncbi:hypothetical protein KUF71_014719 [Frankliniella fusca]|uniref:Uncharacterized protein n=1 Tax=Frankliniella fusca TaxID=407009 RepID=A0AAE1HSA3_9NEOP|nr:hypothetical protein KUF71_014719 [Frankliniella fusca]
MALVPAPQPLSLGGKLEESWAAFKDDIDIYLQANGVDDDKAAAGVLLTFIGREARNHFPNWNIKAEEKKSYKKLVEALDKVTKPTKYPIHSRIMFRSRKRMEGENIEDYVVALRNIAADCEFVAGMEELMIIDNIVESITDPGLQQHLLKQESKGKESREISKIVKEHETLSHAASSMNGNGKTIHHISKFDQYYQKSYENQSRSKSPGRKEYERSSRSPGRYRYERSSRSPGRYRYEESSKSPGRYSKSPSKHQSRSPHRRSSSRESYRRGSTSNSTDRRDRSKFPHRRESPAPESFKRRPCQRCQTRHAFGECPAEGATCNNCGKRNHFTQCCLYGKVDCITVRPNSEASQESMSGSQFKQDPYYYIRTLNQPKKSDRKSAVNIRMIRRLKSVPDEDSSIWYEPIQVCGKTIKYKIDTGSDVETLPIQYISLIPDNCIIKPAPLTLAYGEVEVPVLGKVQLPVVCRGIQTMLDFIIIGKEEVPVLSRVTSVRLGLIQRVHALTPKFPSVQTKEIHHCEELEKTLESITDETTRCFISSNKHLFVGTGKFPDQVTLLVDKTVEATRHPPRRVPLIIEEKVKNYIHKISKEGVVSPVEQPRSWVSHMLIREKPNGSIRVCLDPKDLNKAIKRNYYQIPSVEYIQSRLAGNEFFSVVDSKDVIVTCKINIILWSD